MANTPIETIFPNAAQLDALNAILQTIAGKIGVAATIQIVRVDTLPAGEPATITEAPGSTESARQYIVGIPEGPQGPAYTLTPEDKQTIVQAVLAALPVYNGEVASVG